MCLCACVGGARKREENERAEFAEFLSGAVLKCSPGQNCLCAHKHAYGVRV